MINDTFFYISKNWEKEHYLDSIQNWEEVLKHVVKGSKYICKCGTCFDDNKFICVKYAVCCVCDTMHQPYLSNPINLKCVIKYINPLYWKYIIPSLSNIKQTDNTDFLSVFSIIKEIKGNMVDTKFIVSYIKQCYWKLTIPVLIELDTMYKSKNSIYDDIDILNILIKYNCSKDPYYYCVNDKNSMKLYNGYGYLLLSIDKNIYQYTTGVIDEKYASFNGQKILVDENYKLLENIVNGEDTIYIINTSS